MKLIGYFIYKIETNREVEVCGCCCKSIEGVKNGFFSLDGLFIPAPEALFDTSGIFVIAMA